MRVERLACLIRQGLEKVSRSNREAVQIATVTHLVRRFGFGTVVNCSCRQAEKVKRCHRHTGRVRQIRAWHGEAFYRCTWRGLLDVRHAPIATKFCIAARCRDGPEADLERRLELPPCPQLQTEDGGH